MRIFSGDYSRDMWDSINSAKTVAELREALYLVCCRLQGLESRLTPRALDDGYDPTKNFVSTHKKPTVKKAVTKPAHRK
jgi:hypothetical protein